MNIISVRDKRVKKIVEDAEVTSVKGLDKLEVAKIKDMVSAILAMTHPLQLTAVPAWSAHELKPGMPGKWSLMVTGNYRLTFIVDIEEQQVTVLDYEDYH